MFKDPREKSERQEPNPLDRAGLKGCGLWGTAVWIVMGLAILLWIWNPFGAGLNDTTAISYSAFRQHVKAGNVKRVTVAGQTIKGELIEPAQTQANGDVAIDYESFVTHLPSFGDEELLSLLEDQGVEVNAEPESGFSWWTILLNLVPFVLMIGFGYLLVSRLRRQRQSIFSVGRSRAKLYDREREQTTL